MTSKLIVCLMMLMSSTLPSLANEYNDANCIRAIVGEALPKYEAMLDIASAIRNRGTLNGVYGVKSKNWDNASPKLKAQALKAWAESGRRDTVNGADHWLSEYDLKHCKPSLTAFRFRMVETAHRHQTHFYRKKT